MKGILTAGTVIVGVAANLFVLYAVLMTLAFGGEAYRGRESGLASVLWSASGLIAAASMVFSSCFAWAYFARGRALPYWAPLAAAAAAGAVGFGLINAGERADAVAKERARKAEIDALRAAVAGGRVEAGCELFSKDPQAPAEQMAACRAYIESLPDAQLRWTELKRFAPRDEFAHWNPQELGLSKEWDWNHSVPVIPAAQQLWFVRAYFDAWLSFPETLTSADDVSRLHFLGLSLLTDRVDWSPDVRPFFREKILPRLKERIDRSISARRNDVEFAKDAREELTFLNGMAADRRAD